MTIPKTKISCQALYHEKNIKKAFQPILEKRRWAASKNKIPLNVATGKPAKCNDPSTWGTFTEVNAYCQTNEGCYPTIALSKELGLVCIDLDQVRYENLPKATKDVLERTKTYVERSQSSTGLHIFLLGKKPGNRCKKGCESFEIYEENKFITLTGDIIREHTHIKEDQAAIEELYHAVFTKEDELTCKYISSPPMSDDDVLALCRKAKNKDKFEALFDHGKTSNHSNDDSNADIALCSMMAFYTQDSMQIERLMRKSMLKRHKWNSHTTYISQTIEKALSNLTETYQPSHVIQYPYTVRSNTHADMTAIPPALEEIDITSPEGRFTQIPESPFPIHTLPYSLQQAVKEAARAIKVDPALTALPALGMSALQIGKKAVIEEKKGLIHQASFFFCGVGRTGERKSTAFNIMTKGLKKAMQEEEKTYRKKASQVRAHNKAIVSKIAKAEKSLTEVDLDSTTAEDLKNEIGNLTSSIQPIPPEPQNYSEDITSQRLFQKLHQHNGAYGVISSEGRVVVDRITGNGTSDGATQDTIYLSATWGDDISRSRVGNNTGELGGEDIRINSPALTTVILVQPDKWEEICKDKRLRDSGFISRVLVVKVPSTIGDRLEEPDEMDLDLSQLIPYEKTLITLWRWERDLEHPLMVKLSDKAKERRRMFHNNIEIGLREGGTLEDVPDIASKTVSIACRLALLFTVFKIAENSPEDLNKLIEVHISEDDWLNAQQLQEYFLAQATLSQRENSKEGKVHLQIRAVNWLNRNRANGEIFTPRDLANGLRIKSAVSADLCRELLQKDIIKQAPRPPETKTSLPCYTANMTKIKELPCTQA